MTQHPEQNLTDLDLNGPLNETVCKGLWTHPVKGGHRPNPRMGLEMEFLAYDAQTLAPLGTPGTSLSSADILTRIASASPGSKLKVDEETGVIVGLALENGANFSLEPGAQIEFSSSPRLTLTEVAEEVAWGLRLVEEAAQGQAVFASHGTNPVGFENFPLLVPKSRYQVMTRYFGSESGGRGLHMMRQTCTVQPNIDIAGEEAWTDAVNLSFVLTPFMRHLFANSAFFEGERSKFFSERQMIWTAMDPSRCGMPNDVLNSQDVPCSYVRWAMDSYVFMVDGLPKEEQPLFGELRFSDWLRSGYKGIHPRLKDWEGHLGTLFPDLRLRTFLEVRSTDAQPFEHTFAPMAFWSLLQNTRARKRFWDYLNGILSGVTHFLPLQNGASAGEKLLALPVDHPLFADKEVHKTLLSIALECQRDLGETIAIVSLEAYLDFASDKQTYWQGSNGKEFLARTLTSNPASRFMSHLGELSRRQAGH